MVRGHILFLGLLAAASQLPGAGDGRRYPSRPDIPSWWQAARAFYCPLANSGAGSSLMKFKAHREKNFRTFTDLDRMLDDAESLGTNIIYLVDYWEPDYEHKAEYRPRLRWGGDAAFREGVERVHRRGGRVILYLEAFIISRDTELARRVGPRWAMMDENGRYYPYYNTGSRFYLMYPGKGSGWADHLVGVAGRLARDFKIDGVHLDSYGLQWGWRDYHPDHPGGRDPGSFNRGALELVRRIRAELRKHVPHAVVILEGAEHVELLDVCDGAQIESLPILRKKKWSRSRRYPIFTSSFSLAEMEEILKEDHNLALSPWWFTALPRGRDRKALAQETDKRNRFDQIEALHRYDNILGANGRIPDPPADFPGLFQGIIDHLNKNGWGSKFAYPPLVREVRRYQDAYQENRDRLTRTPADAIREMLKVRGKQAMSTVK